MRFNLIFIILSVTLINSALGKDLRPEGKFHKDSVKTGEHLKFTLAFHHSRNMQVIFPDTTYDFYPFEIITKTFYPTVSTDELSADSVVYLLRTFEPADKHVFKLPVYVLGGKDSITIFSNEDSVFIKKSFLDSNNQAFLKENTTFIKIKESFNYPFWIAGFTTVALLLTIAYLLLGKIIRRKYKIYMMRKAHMSFLKEYEKNEKEFLKNYDIKLLENSVSLWKLYISKLEQKPINSYTTTEIIKIYEVEELSQSLQTIDRAIFGGYLSDKPDKALKKLKKFSNKKYMKVKNEVSRG